MVCKNATRGESQPEFQMNVTDAQCPSTKIMTWWSVFLAHSKGLVTFLDSIVFKKYIRPFKKGQEMLEKAFIFLACLTSFHACLSVFKASFHALYTPALDVSFSSSSPSLWPIYVDRNPRGFGTFFTNSLAVSGSQKLRGFGNSVLWLPKTIQDFPRVVLRPSLPKVLSFYVH